MPGQPAIFIAPSTNRRLKVTVEPGKDNSSKYSIFFEGKDDPLTPEEMLGLPTDQPLEGKGIRTYLACSEDQYQKLMVKGPGLVLIPQDPVSGGRRLKKRRATRRAKKHTRRSRS